MPREQEQLKWRLVEEDCEEVRSWEEDTVQFARLRVVAGVDVSFTKDDPDQACAMLAVLSYPQLKVVSFLIFFVLQVVDSFQNHLFPASATITLSAS